MTIQQSQDQVRDAFDSPEFEGGRDRLPYLQMLNNQKPDEAGFFITLENMDQAKFDPNEDWALHTAMFPSGATVDGYRSLTARFLILQRSNLMMFDRDSGDYIGLYKRDQYSGASMVLKTRYLVYLISKNKLILHETPLQLTTKGAFCGNFGATVKKFREDMSKAYTAATNVTKPRGDRFMSLSILAVKVKPELKGNTKKSWVCSVDSYGVPTPDNWDKYFIGYNEDLKTRVLNAVDEYADFAKFDPTSETAVNSTSGSESGFDEFDY